MEICTGRLPERDVYKRQEQEQPLETEKLSETSKALEPAETGEETETEATETEAAEAAANF